jgi:hypothetical protein
VLQLSYTSTNIMFVGEARSLHKSGASERSLIQVGSGLNC